MKYLKSLAVVLAADVFSLFIGLTLAGSSLPVIRLISAVCTFGILVVFMANFAVKTASEDMKSGKKNLFSVIGMGLSASAPSILSWITLYISVCRRSFDFYRWYKIINGYFLQIYNFIDSDASSSELSLSEVWMMLPLAFIPAAVFIAVCILVYKGVIMAC